MQPTPRIADAVTRLKGVFLEIPGTQLTIGEACRLSGLELNTCSVVMEALEDARFLRRVRNGLFTRRDADTPQLD